MTDRDITINEIHTALRRRSGKAWSVTGGRGTSWGWIRISAPPARRETFGYMSAADAAELGQLLNLDGAAHAQGVSVPASSCYYREYVDRANGRAFVAATPYWD